MASTVVGVFDNKSDAAAAERDLIAAGFDRSGIQVTHGGDARFAKQEDPGFWESLKAAFGFSSEEDRYTYGEAARRGSSIVSVTTREDYAERMAEILERHNPVDVDQRAAQWRSEGWTGYQPRQQAGQATAARKVEGKETIPVVEERLKVGKRAVRGGGVRVHSVVTERPVQESVQLREEHVHVERRPTDRPVTAADQPFKERVIEATETREEAVAAKEARVVEEVTVSKDATQRTQTVRDTVRRTDVRVDELDTDPRFAPAHEFATSQLAQYRGRSWDEIEPEARRSFEQTNPGRWSEFRDAIRARWDRDYGTAHQQQQQAGAQQSSASASR